MARSKLVFIFIILYLIEGVKLFIINGFYLFLFDFWGGWWSCLWETVMNGIIVLMGIYGGAFIFWMVSFFWIVWLAIIRNGCYRISLLFPQIVFERNALTIREFACLALISVLAVVLLVYLVFWKGDYCTLYWFNRNDRIYDFKKPGF